MQIELKMLRARVIKKTTGANIHRARNLLGAASMIIEQYDRTEDKEWLDLYEKAIASIIDFLKEG
ncbi:MAG TPA: hypothetical protein DD381_04935 [Lentisphaeria bacterium]|nr:hypothetical protein [Lentisphaeria bacterium]